MRPKIFAGYRVSCQFCSASSKLMPSGHEAATLWNRRNEHCARIEEPLSMAVTSALFRAASHKVLVSGGSLCVLAMFQKDGDFSIGLYPYEHNDGEADDM